MGVNCGHKGQTKKVLRQSRRPTGVRKRATDEAQLVCKAPMEDSADAELDSLCFGISVVVFACESVSRRLCWRYFDAMGNRRPDGLRLRLQRDAFGIGYTVAELGGFATMDNGGAGVKTKDCELLAAQLLDGEAVLLALFLRAFLSGLTFEVAALLPAGDHNKDDAKESNDEHGGGIQQRVLQQGLRFVHGVRQHAPISKVIGLMQQK